MLRAVIRVISAITLSRLARVFAFTLVRLVVTFRVLAFLHMENVAFRSTLLLIGLRGDRGLLDLVKEMPVERGGLILQSVCRTLPVDGRLHRDHVGLLNILLRAWCDS